MTKARHVLPFRRKREGKTNYKKRLALLKSGLPRLVLRKSNKHVQLQLVEYRPDGDHVLVTVSSKTLAQLGWQHGTKSIPAAYCAGLITGKRCVEKGVKDAIVDLGLQKHRAGTVLYAAVKGVIDGGLAVRAQDAVFPPPERLAGSGLTAAKQDEVAALIKKAGGAVPSKPSKKEDA